MMNKQDIYHFLTVKKIPYEFTEHKAVYNMDELAEINLPHPETEAKNLFIRDDKKLNYYLITVKGNKRVDLKEFRKANQTRPLSFASEQDLFDMIGLTAGSVTPLGILNDKECKVRFFLDKDFFNEPGLIAVHPNDNTATVWLKTDDLVKLIKEHGNEINVVQI